MKQAERDALAAQNTEALAHIAERLDELGGWAARRERRARERELPPVPRPPRHRPEGFHGFDTPVPAGHVSGMPPAVRCAADCGAETVLALSVPMACAGECGRWFVRTRAGVRSRRFEQ